MPDLEGFDRSGWEERAVCRKSLLETVVRKCALGKCRAVEKLKAYQNSKGNGDGKQRWGCSQGSSERSQCRNASCVMLRIWKYRTRVRFCFVFVEGISLSGETRSNLFLFCLLILGKKPIKIRRQSFGFSIYSSTLHKLLCFLISVEFQRW